MVDILVVLVGTVQQIDAGMPVFHLIVGRVAHSYLSRTPYISRIGTARNGFVDMAVEDIYIGNTDDITLLTATIDEVGRYVTFHFLSHSDFRISIYITLHTVACTKDIEGRVFRLGSQELVGIIQLFL